MRHADAQWIRWMGAVSAGLLWVSGVAADETADRLTEARLKAGEVKSYQAEFTLTVIEENQTPTTLKGTVWYQRPDKRRIEFAPPVTEDVAELVVSNGAFEWQYFPTTQAVYKTDWAAVQSAGVAADALELRGLHQPFIDTKPETIRLVTTKADGPETLYVFEAEPAATLAAEAPFAPGRLRIEVGAEDGLTRRLTMTDAQGREVLVQQYTAIQVNVPVAASQFEFTPPVGARVEDISKERIQAATGVLPPEGIGEAEATEGAR